MMKIGTHRSGPARLTLGKARALPSHMQGQILELSGLWCNVSDRRNGHASSLVSEICIQADMEGFFLFLAVAPGFDTDITPEDLAKFYAKSGFGIIQVEPMLMVRPPVRARIAIAQAAH